MSRTTTVVGYLLIAAAAVGYQLAGLALGRTPTVGHVLSLLARHRPGRWTVLAGWLWVGWHLFVRSHVG